MKYREYYSKLKELEEEKKYDVDINAGEYKLTKEIKPNHKYVYNGFWDKVYYAFLRVIIFIFAPILNFLVYDLRVRGRKNLKGIKQAIVISNHVTLLESLILKQVVFRRIYYVGGAHNNKKGFGGYTLKILGFIPLSNIYSNQKKLAETIKYHLDKGNLVAFDPEQAMWRGYDKIRPFKNGAFYYAQKNDAPIIPIVQLLRKVNFFDKLIGRKFKVTVKVLPPIYINKSLDVKAQIEDVKLRARQSMVDCSSEFYGKETDVLKLE